MTMNLPPAGSGTPAAAVADATATATSVPAATAPDTAGTPHAAPSARMAAPSAPGPLGLLVMLSGTFMVTLDFFIVAVALPSIQRDLDASTAALQWIVIGYGLATAAGLVTGGRLGDIHGRRRMFMLGLVLFSLASAACGLAPSAAVLVAARIAQGLAGALMQPQVTAMLNLLYAGAARARAFAAYGLTLGLGAACGQLVGGLLIHADLGGLGWRSCFLINLPVGLLALVLCPRTVPALPARAGQRLDLAGAALLALSLVLLLVPLVQGPDAGWPAWCLAALAATVPAAMAFWRQQRRLSARGGLPLLAPQLLAQPGFGLGTVEALLFYCGNASLYFVVALYLQQGLGLAPLASGLVFTTMAVTFFASSVAAPRLAPRLGGQTVVAGAVVLAIGHGAMAWLVGTAAQPPVPALVALLLVQGCGLGLVMSPMIAAILAGLPAQHAGVASGVLATVQHMGNALGVALIGMIYHAPQAGAGQGFARSLAYLAMLACAVALLHRRFAIQAAQRAASTA